VSQPALSQTIRKLEAQLGFDLLVRTTRGVRLTPAGQAFYEDAVAALAQLDRMVERARQVALTGTGSLAVGYVPLVRRPALRVIAQMARVRPGVAIAYRQEYTPLLFAGLRSGDLDVAVVVASVVDAAPIAHASMELCDLPLPCVVREDHPLADAETVTLADVARYPIPYGALPGMEHWADLLRSVFADAGLEPKLIPSYSPVTEQPEADDEHAALFVWIQTDDYEPWGRLLRLEPEVTCRFSLVWRDGPLAPALRDFLEVARATRDAEGWLRA
jgi:DNA-binding transcriptional LysR family regulator